MAKDKDHKDHKKPKEKDKEKEKKETKSKEPVSKPKEEEVFQELAKKKSHGAEQGKLHKEIMVGDADMVHKAGASSGPGHERPGGTRFITLAGENKGASMKIGAKSKDKERHSHYWLGDDDEEEGGKGVPVLINSNVQVINNSLLLKSSCSGGDPWVYLKLSAQSKSKDKQQQGSKFSGGGGPHGEAPPSPPSDSLRPFGTPAT